MLVLPGLLAVALSLRLYSIAFGLPALNDPDELTFELGALKMLRGATLNPGWFGHPATTTMYVLAVLTVAVFAVGHLFGRFASVQDFAEAIYADPSWVMLPGRVAMALFAVSAVYLTYRLARELFGPQAGLAAAALLAVSPVHVTWSQIIRSDVMGSFFMLLCMLAALRIARQGRWRDYVLAALWLGAATATKWPCAIVALSVAGAGALRLARGRDQVPRGVRRLALFGLVAIGFLLLISPYLLLDYPTLLRNLHGEVQPHHLGATGGSPWSNAWWYLSGPLVTGLGAAGLALAAGGLVLAARHEEAAAVVLPVLLGFFVLLCAQHLIWERWAVPLLPLLAICAGAAFAKATQALAPPQIGWAATTLLAIALLLPPALRAHSDSRARLNDTRQLASAWAVANVPAGSTVLLEHFAFDLQAQPWRFLFPLGDAGCIDARALLHGKVQLGAIEASRGGRSNIDYGTVAPAKRDTCRADYAILAHADRYAAERTAFPAEDAAYRELIARGRLVTSFTPGPDSAGPVIRIIKFER